MVAGGRCPNGVLPPGNSLAKQKPLPQPGPKKPKWRFDRAGHRCHYRVMVGKPKNQTSLIRGVLSTTSPAKSNFLSFHLIGPKDWAGPELEDTTASDVEDSLATANL
jgi:hypothetical protein